MKHTPWFPEKIKPARAGCYEVAYDEGQSELPFPFHFFNGYQWVRDCSSKPFESEDRCVSEGIGYSVPCVWRGLVEKS